jgi:hypothetical protein
MTDEISEAFGKHYVDQLGDPPERKDLDLSLFRLAYTMGYKSAETEAKEKLDITLEALKKSWCVTNGMWNRVEDGIENHEQTNYEQAKLLSAFLQEAITKLEGKKS